jgi:osmotically-inducible protein OsmY
MSVSTASKTDMDIRERVEKELDWTRQVEDSANIGVAVDNGVVALSGEVSTYSQKVAAAKAALRTRGVTAVANDIVVRYTGRKSTDAEIAEAARNVLALTVTVPKDSIKIEVRDAVVTLSGVVDWDYQRRAAKRAIENTPSVEGVFSQISLKPRVSAIETESMVKRAILRNASLDAKSISVDVIGNRVVLHGTVASYAEKKQAGLAAWSSPHVTEVDNKILIRTP